MAMHRGCDKSIAAALHTEGMYLLDSRVSFETGDATVLEAFDALRNPCQEVLPDASHADSVLRNMKSPGSRI
jgi:hypothetical protein